MNWILLLIFFTFFMAGCKPSYEVVDKAIVQPQVVYPTRIPIPTPIPAPTRALPTKTPTISMSNEEELYVSDLQIHLVKMKKGWDVYNELIRMTEEDLSYFTSPDWIASVFAILQVIEDEISEAAAIRPPASLNNLYTNLLNAKEELYIGKGFLVEALLEGDTVKMGLAQDHLHNHINYINWVTEETLNIKK
ncbi:MAG: hypothetical protein ACYC36_16575 [Bellilinea sp.]